MRSTKRLRLVLPGLAGIAMVLSSCTGSSHPIAGSGRTVQSTPTSSQRSAPAEKPVPAESNPPGDIPDTTQFVSFDSAQGHFALKVPEGWSRTNGADTLSFSDKLNAVAVTWSSASSAPTPSSVRDLQIPKLRTTERAFVLSKIIPCNPKCTIPYTTGPISVSLAGGNAIVLTYRENSAPNPVTGKQYRLEVIRFDFYRSGEEADLVLSGPVGADNVDPWRLVAQSFRWA